MGLYDLDDLVVAAMADIDSMAFLEISVYAAQLKTAINININISISPRPIDAPVSRRARAVSMRQTRSSTR